MSGGASVSHSVLKAKCKRASSSSSSPSSSSQGLNLLNNNNNINMCADVICYGGEERRPGESYDEEDDSYHENLHLLRHNTPEEPRLLLLIVRYLIDSISIPLLLFPDLCFARSSGFNISLCIICQLHCTEAVDSLLEFVVLVH